MHFSKVSEIVLTRGKKSFKTKRNVVYIGGVALDLTHKTLPFGTAVKQYSSTDSKTYDVVFVKSEDYIMLLLEIEHL